MYTVPLLYPLKTSGFLMFSGGIELEPCTYQGVQNVRVFLESLACFVFMKHSLWDSPFSILPTVCEKLKDLTEAKLTVLWWRSPAYRNQPLVYTASQWTNFYFIYTFVMKELMCLKESQNTVINSGNSVTSKNSLNVFKHDIDFRQCGGRIENAIET